ncbi:MAG: hypothetical protein R6T90_08065, partial [Dissulfuribacterales bacterium]
PSVILCFPPEISGLYSLPRYITCSAIIFNSHDMSFHGTPTFYLSFILFFYSSTHKVTTIPLEPTTRIILIYPTFLLVLATNENNILTRFVLQGRYAKSKVIPTISPSMDIQVASNFERYLYYLYNQESERVKRSFMFLDKKDVIIINQEEQAKARRDFVSASIDQATTIKTIRDTYEETGYIIDPHTAVGVAAAERLKADLQNGPTVCLATAHPAKFPDALNNAIGKEPERPKSLEGIEDRPSRYEVLPAEVDAVKNYIVKHAL